MDAIGDLAWLVWVLLVGAFILGRLYERGTSLDSRQAMIEDLREDAVVLALLAFIGLGNLYELYLMGWF